MSYGFMIVLREGFEAFLIVAITLAYLRKTKQDRLVPSVHWAIGTSVVVSILLGYVLLQGVNQALWEGVLGLITVVLIASLVIHMWRIGPRLKSAIENQLTAASASGSNWKAFLGVFLFTVLMITREGMETALMLFQVRDQNLIAGAFLGLAAAASLAWGWARFGHRVNLGRFFQVTSIYLMLFMLQVAIYSFHELAEAGILPNSEELHAATEILSPDGLYGQWFSMLIVAICAFWLFVASGLDRVKRPGAVDSSAVQS
jgi:high-affinity iron transporter